MRTRAVFKQTKAYVPLIASLIAIALSISNFYLASVRQSSKLRINILQIHELEGPKPAVIAVTAAFTNLGNKVAVVSEPNLWAALSKTNHIRRVPEGFDPRTLQQDPSERVDLDVYYSQNKHLTFYRSPLLVAPNSVTLVTIPTPYSLMAFGLPADGEIAFEIGLDFWILDAAGRMSKVEIPRRDQSGRIRITINNTRLGNRSLLREALDHEVVM